jgi:hypothetical protein
MASSRPPQLSHSLWLSRAADDGTLHAHGFAERLGLPAYRWLSPDYVEKDTQHFINAGARKMGRRPAKPATTKLPAPRKLDLPKPGLTAREALMQLKPMLKWCRPPCTLKHAANPKRPAHRFTPTDNAWRKCFRPMTVVPGIEGTSDMDLRQPDLKV